MMVRKSARQRDDAVSSEQPHGQLQKLHTEEETERFFSDCAAEETFSFERPNNAESCLAKEGLLSARHLVKKNVSDEVHR